jgi:hypothetical protein
MPKTAQDLEGLDVKVESKFMKWLKRIAYIVTIATTISGGVLGVLSYIREVKDPKAEAGYEALSIMLKESSIDIRENREEIRHIYRAIVNMKSGQPVPEAEDKARILPKTPIQKPLDWTKLKIKKVE